MQPYGPEPGYPQPSPPASTPASGRGTTEPAPRTLAAGSLVAPPGPTPVELDQLEADLRAVDRALERLDAGTYGSCELCGAPIGDETLAQLPAAAVCADHLPVGT